MVALLTSDPIHTLPLRHAEPSEAPIARRSRPRHLHAAPELLPVPTPRHAPRSVPPGADAGSEESFARSIRPVLSATELSAIGAAIVVAIVFVGSFGSLQAPPSPATWADVYGSSAPVDPLDVGETLVTVEPGDTLWGLAGVIAPDADRRQVVQMLAERNGGSSIWAGQELIVPGSLANL